MLLITNSIAQKTVSSEKVVLEINLSLKNMPVYKTDMIDVDEKYAAICLVASGRQTRLYVSRLYTLFIFQV